MNRTLRLSAALMLVCSLILMASASHAASFDCAKAQTSVEKLICADPTLGERDAALGAAYTGLATAGPDRVSLRKQQRDWIAKVRDRCRDKQCLLSAYTARIDYLNQQLGAPKQQSSSDPTCGVGVPKIASQPCKTSAVCAENPDRSVLQAIVAHCAADRAADIGVYFYANKQSRPVLLETVRNEDALDVAWGAPDRNGFAELDVMQSCGAGPNCFHELYRYDPQAKQLYHYFSGGYSDLIDFDGYVVESGRGGCCEWEYHAYKLHRQGMRDIVDDKFFIIAVNVNTEDESKPASCTFSEVVDPKNWKTRPMQPPGKKWLKFCEYYGKKYKLN